MKKDDEDNDGKGREIKKGRRERRKERPDNGRELDAAELGKKKVEWSFGETREPRGDYVLIPNGREEENSTVPSRVCPFACIGDGIVHYFMESVSPL